MKLRWRAIGRPAARLDNQGSRRPERIARHGGPGAHRCACGGGCPRCRARRQELRAPGVAVTRPGDYLEVDADWLVRRALDGGAAANRPGRLRQPPAGPHISVLGPGVPLPAALRADLEPRFGVVLDDLRLHLDAAAARSAAGYRALAYALGNHVVFDPGHYRPSSSSGRRLIAHEIAHTLQPDVRSGRVLARAPAPPVDEDAIPPLDASTFAERWEEFEQLRLDGDIEAALALVPDLLLDMSPGDAIEHAGELAVWLLAHDARDLAELALSQLDSGWWLRYVTIPAEPLPEQLTGGFGTPAGPGDLLTQAETEARAGRHDIARRLLQSAYLMTQMLLAQTVEKYQGLLAEAGADIARLLPGVILESTFQTQTALRSRIVSLYPHLASETHRAGDEASTEVLVEQGKLFIESLTQMPGSDEGLELGSAVAPAEQTEPPVTPGAGPSSDRPPASDRPVTPEEPEVPDQQPDADPVLGAIEAGEALPDEPDRLVEGLPPFQGGTAIQFHGNVYARVDSSRFVVTTSLGRAASWARNLFGVVSSIVVMHFDDDRRVRFYVAALNGDFTDRMPAPEPGRAVPVEVATRLEKLPNDYEIILIHVGNGIGFWPSSNRATAYQRVLARETASGQAALDPQLVASTLFDPIDELIAGSEDEQEQAAERLGELDAAAFSTLDFDTRTRYITHLLTIGPSDAQERAIVEILKSLESRTEFEAVLAAVRADEGAWDALIDDMDVALWSLLTTVGQRFGSPEPLTLGDALRFMSEAGLLTVATPIPGISIGPNGPEISLGALAEIEESANSFIRFIKGIWDGIVMLLTRPDKVFEGLAQLLRMVVVFELAKLGYQPAIEVRNHVLTSIGTQLLHGFKGVAVLGLEKRYLTRLKWAIIWEIASWFIGVGTVSAAVAGLGISAKAGAIARFLRLLGLAGEAAQAEKVGSILSRLANILSRSSRVLRTEEEVLVFLARLPEDDAARLARALEGIDLDDGMDLARLTAAHPELAGVAQDSLRNAETLSSLASKAGGFTDEIGSAFARLRGAGHSTEDLATLIGHVPEGEGARFAQMITRLPEEVSLGSGSLGVLRTVASSPSRMGAVSRYGLDTVSAAFRRAGADGALLDDYLEAIAAIEARMPSGTGPADLQRFLERVQQRESSAMFEVEEQIRQGAGKARLGPKLRQAVNDWAQGFPQRPAVNPGTNAHQFQVRECGATETQVAGGGERVWADGLIPDEALLRDAKLTENLRSSPFIDANPHQIPAPVLRTIRAKIDDELSRYARVIADPDTPVIGLEIVTSTPLSVPFWQRMLRQFGIPGRVVVHPFP